MQRYVRFLYNDNVSYGLLNQDIITLLTGSHPDEFRISHATIHVGSVKLLAPCTPTKAVCVGLNYKDAKLGPGTSWPKEPLLFIKPSTSVNDPGENIVKNPMCREIAYEAELAVVIGRKASRISEADAEQYIWGFTIANDVTARDLQRADGLWARSKSFDTFLPLGPSILSGSDARSLDIFSYVNGNCVQSGNTRNLIFGIDYLVSFISHVMTLHPGDVILTGTPGGYGGTLNIGDKVEINISSIGWLTNYVTANNEPWYL